MTDDSPRARPVPDLAFATAWYGGGAVGGFAAGTLLETAAGSVAVERLRPGDWLVGGRDGAVRLRHVARCAGPAGPLVLLPPDALGPGRPRRALLLAARQAVWLAGGEGHHALAAGGLVCGGGVGWVTEAPPLHILVAEGDGVVLAEGLACALRPPTRPERDPGAGAALAAARLAQQGVAPQRIDGAVTLDARCRLVGWAIDRAAPHAPVLLEVLVGDLTGGFALADEARPDLGMAGLGACGFTIALPTSCMGVTTSLVSVRAVGGGAVLSGAPLLVAAEARFDGRE